MSKHQWLLRLVLLALALVGAGRANADFGDCADAEYMRVFDVRLGSSACDVVGTAAITWSGHTAQLRVLKIRGSTLVAPDALMAKVRHLADIVGRAMDRMGEVSIADVSILLTDDLPPDGSFAHTYTLGAARGELRRPRRRLLDQDCQVAFFKGDAHSEDEFSFAYSHELFHCVQFRTWPRQMGTRGADWWIEGTADYFAFLANQGTTAYTEHLLRFDETSPNTALHEMSYEAVVFFAWLARTRGEHSIPAFIGGMPIDGTPQLTALQRSVTSDAWIDFSKTYLDRGIQLPGGRFIPSVPQSGETLRISASGSFAMRAAPFVLVRRKIRFASGHAFSIAFDDRPSDARVLWSSVPAGPWSAPPPSLTPCEADEQFRETRGTTTSNTAGTMRITATTSRAHCDCLVGNWVMTTPSLLANLRQKADRHSQAITHISGGLRLEFNPDATPTSLGTGLYVHDRIVFRTDFDGSSGRAYRETTINASAQIKWNKAEHSPALVIVFPNRNERWGTIHTETFTRQPQYPNARGEDGVARPITKDEPMGLGSGGLGPLLGGTYVCRVNNLRIENPGLTGGAYSFDFVRLPPAPAGAPSR